MHWLLTEFVVSSVPGSKVRYLHDFTMAMMFLYCVLAVWVHCRCDSKSDVSSFCSLCSLKVCNVHSVSCREIPTVQIFLCEVCRTMMSECGSFRIFWRSRAGRLVSQLRSYHSVCT
jgi:hypothetical protein